ncbi:MAG: hypothetical protein K9N11_04840 [Lentisphaeria bacterium]|nr:hypothetical protein [Candidatus Neomarinimicrobiota bacterium]MCF7842162.1 hypothetical protein [Lentisphaeria bacterium]
MISGLSLILVFNAWWACDQLPTSIEDKTKNDALGGESVVVSVLALDFDYSAGRFFVTVKVLSKDSVERVVGEFSFNDSVYAQLTLADDGQGEDILPGDSQFNGIWNAGGIDPAVQSDWGFTATAYSTAGDSASAGTTIHLTPPEPPLIEAIQAPDTLYLDDTDWVLDTLRAQVSHPEGLDEIRDVFFRSKRPSDSNFGAAFNLWDDGGQTVLFIIPLQNDTLRLSSFDAVAGDGIYSFPIALNPAGQTGTTHYQFQARAWNGQITAIVSDSLVILPAASVRNTGIMTDSPSTNQTPWN